VHIDFDHLINDFNGNARTSDWTPAAGAPRSANRKTDVFFAALRAVRLVVDRWITQQAELMHPTARSS
jgi:hypothetical protein